MRAIETFATASASNQTADQNRKRVSGVQFLGGEIQGVRDLARLLDTDAQDSEKKRA